MPRGVYPRTPNQLKAAKANLAKGREPAARARASKTLKKIAQDEGWRRKVSEATKAAMRRPEVREKHLKGLAKASGYDLTPSPNSIIPLSLALSTYIAQEYVDRFWARVDIKGDDECWLFQGTVQEYGSFWIGGVEMASHRFVVMLKIGRKLEEGEQALHHCDNPPCVNPSHLCPNTNADNMADKMARGRFSNGRGVYKKK